MKSRVFTSVFQILNFRRIISTYFQDVFSLMRAGEMLDPSSPLHGEPSCWADHSILHYVTFVSLIWWPAMTKALKANEAVERSIDSEPSEHDDDREDYVPVQRPFITHFVEESQTYRQSVDERTAHESVVGLYDNQAKKKCRSDVISHARCLTTERHTSACVQRSHVRRVWQQLQESGKSQAYFIPRVIESIEAEISQWEILHENKIQSRKPSDLSVCYLGGDNPINDLEVLMDNGVLFQNVWAVEKKT